MSISSMRERNKLTIELDGEDLEALDKEMEEWGYSYNDYTSFIRFSFNNREKVKSNLRILLKEDSTVITHIQDIARNVKFSIGWITSIIIVSMGIGYCIKMIF